MSKLNLVLTIQAINQSEYPAVSTHIIACDTFWYLITSYATAWRSFFGTLFTSSIEFRELVSASTPVNLFESFQTSTQIITKLNRPILFVMPQLVTMTTICQMCTTTATVKLIAYVTFHFVSLVLLIYYLHFIIVLKLCICFGILNQITRKCKWFPFVLH